MVKTNKVVYPFKVSFNGINLEELKTKFAPEKFYDNFITLTDGSCKVSLSFLKEENGMIYFSLAKCDNHNITVSDFAQRRDIPSFLNTNQKVKQYSLFAIIPDSNVMLVLFNDYGFRYVIPVLNYYLDKKLGMKIDSKIMTRDFNDEDIQRFCRDTKKIVIERARETPIQYSQRATGSSRRRMKEYIQRKQEVIEFTRLKGVPENSIMKIIKKSLDKNIYDKIVINTYNLGDFDILDSYVMHYKCNVGVNADGLAVVDEFVEICEDIKEKQNGFFQGYELPS